MLTLIAIFFCLIVISRRVDVVTYPQFYAEDGVFWYSEAYSANNFWEPFLIPKQKYFQTISRVGGTLGNLVDIGYAPIIFNWVAILLEVLPAMYFLSSRFSKLVPKFYMRFLCSLAYLLLLGTAETHANLTNAQWRLALLMFLIIIAPESKRIGWKIFDSFFLLLAGLSGPFIFFALPTAIIYYFYRKSFRIFYSRLAILGSTFLIQLYSFLFIVTDATRSTQPLGASWVNFFQILSGNIFLRSIFSQGYVGKIRKLALWESGQLPIIIGIVGIAVLIYVIWKAELELKLLIIFTFLVFTAALVSPQVSLERPQWEAMDGGSGGRYYLLPRLAWVVSLGWLFFNTKLKTLKIFATIMLACFIFVGLPKDWTFNKFHNYHFEKQVTEFKNTNAGEMYKFKIVPGWEMSLVKK